MQTISTSIHDNPASIITPFELLLDEGINDDLLHIIVIFNTREM